jgi:hypothetical protein
MDQVIPWVQILLYGDLGAQTGFAVNPVSAGFVAGAVGSLTGVTFLELHCPLFEAPHLLVWHTAVVPVSAMTGAALGWAWGTLADRSPNFPQFL